MWATVFLMAGCGGEPRGSAPDAGNTAASLTAIGDHAEVVYQALSAGESGKARDGLAKIELLIAEIEAPDDLELPEIEALRGLADGVERALDTGNRARALENANRLAYVAATAADRFDPQIPGALGRLAYFARELERRSAPAPGEPRHTRGPSAEVLSTFADSIRNNWHAVSQEVTGRGGEDTARRFAESLRQLEEARETADYRALAPQLLEQVDEIERLFSEHP